ncbi:hypothetical protein FLAVO9R_20077 [Flavobacterium sp. 9R]|nr:hypothetical protein FLAVO9R_20077 [Flavobacterium sp. 9R]
MVDLYGGNNERKNEAFERKSQKSKPIRYGNRSLLFREIPRSQSKKNAAN